MSHESDRLLRAAQKVGRLMALATALANVCTTIPGCEQSENALALAEIVEEEATELGAILSTEELSAVI